MVDSKKTLKKPKTLRAKSLSVPKLVLNPYTGEFVSTSTKIGKKLEFLVSLCGKCSDDLIYNYKTKKCVKPSGKIGKILMDEIDFCKKYKSVNDAYQQIDGELIKKIGNIEIPRKYMGEDVKVKDLAKVIDDDKVLNKIIHDNLPSELSGNFYASLLISVLLVILKIIVGGGPVSEFIYKKVSDIITVANKTFTSIYITTLLNKIKNSSMLSLIYGFSFSGLAVFIISIFNSFMAFRKKHKAPWDIGVPLNNLDLPIKNYESVKWVSLENVPNFIRTIDGLEDLENSGIVRTVVDKKTGRKTYEINTIELGILTRNIVENKDIISGLSFDPFERLLTISINDKANFGRGKNILVLNTQIDISNKTKKNKVSELKEMLYKLGVSFNTARESLQNEENKLKAYKIKEGIDNGRYEEKNYSSQELSKMTLLIKDYTHISDAYKENLKANIKYLREFIDIKEKTLFKDISKLSPENINIVYDTLKKDIEESEMRVGSLLDISAAITENPKPQLNTYPGAQINNNLINQATKPKVINDQDYDPEIVKPFKGLAQVRKEMEDEKKIQERMRFTREELFGKKITKVSPKKVSPKKISPKKSGDKKHSL